MKYFIKNRHGMVVISVSINCADHAPDTLRLGLAVKQALRSGMDLFGADLQGASLRGANLYRANLRDADLRGADLRGAYLRGAGLQYARLDGAQLRSVNLSGADICGTGLVDGGEDRRGYRFVGQPSDIGVNVLAGCRYFSTIADARAHWGRSHLAEPELRAECLAKVDLIEAVAKARGWLK